MATKPNTTQHSLDYSAMTITTRIWKLCAINRHSNISRYWVHYPSILDRSGLFTWAMHQFFQSLSSTRLYTELHHQELHSKFVPAIRKETGKTMTQISPVPTYNSCPSGVGLIIIHSQQIQFKRNIISITSVYNRHLLKKGSLQILQST